MILLSQSAPPSWWLPSVQTTWMSSPVDPDDRGVEGAAAEVIDEDVPRRPGLVQRLVVQRGGDRFGQDVEHVQPGDLPGLAGGLAFQHARSRPAR